MTYDKGKEQKIGRTKNSRLMMIQATENSNGYEDHGLEHPYRLKFQEFKAYVIYFNFVSLLD